MTDLLTPEQASPIVGVPAVQLRRWAYLRQGPPNRGTKHKPMYDEGDLIGWKPTSNESFGAPIIVMHGDA